MKRPGRLIKLTKTVRRCYACSAMDYCHVLGESNGPAPARVMFVGEAPGRLGAGRSGVPFLGDESGRRFEALLALAGLRRDQVFVTNAVLCNPLDAARRNRRPLRREVDACLPFLRGQIDAVAPAIVVALGGVALHALGRIERHEAALATHAGRGIAWYGRLLVPVYHPGRRALVHRGAAQQAADWAALGEIVSKCTGPAADAPVR